MTFVILAFCFNRRRDACFPATWEALAVSMESVSCFNRRRDACFPATQAHRMPDQGLLVSIADATLASPQRKLISNLRGRYPCFNRRRDACFPATDRRRSPVSSSIVSIADATLASPQQREAVARSQQ